MFKTFALPLAAALIAAAATPAFAHHSFVMFDKHKEVTLTGTVEDFEDTNPHAKIVMMVTGGGRPGEWTILSESPLVLKKVGIHDSTLSAGEKVTVRVHPLKDGGTEGSLIDLRTEDGMMLALGGYTYGELMK